MRLRERLADFPAAGKAPSLPADLSPLAGRLLKLMKDHETLSVGDAAEALGANRNTQKDKFVELVERGHAQLHGKGRGAHHRLVKD